MREFQAQGEPGERYNQLESHAHTSCEQFELGAAPKTSIRTEPPEKGRAEVTGGIICPNMPGADEEGSVDSNDKESDDPDIIYDWTGSDKDTKERNDSSNLHLEQK